MKDIATFMLAALLLAPGFTSAADRKSPPESHGAAAEAALPKKLDLNRASREELVGIPGIGSRMAQAIVDLRTKKGAFKRVEELLEVPGIKEKKFASINAYLEVIPPKQAAAAAPAAQPK